jgi:hypothetical protein
MSTHQLDHDEVESVILEVASECYQKGPGFAQEGVVLREVATRLGVAVGETAIEDEQVILTCWHDLFRKGKLSWGYNIDTPDSPWFHFRNRGNGDS